MGFKENAEQHLQDKLAPQARHCKAVTIADGLSVEDRDWYFKVVLPDSQGFSAREVRNLLRQEGLEIAESTILAHRAHNCGCSR